MSFILELLNWWSTTEGISTVVAIVVGAIGSITSIIVTAVNNARRKNGNCKCCLTGRPLKPKKK